MSSTSKLITLPNEKLRQGSKKVGLITPEISQIIDEMKQATLDWESHRQHELGVALAAIQIDIPYRIIIIRSSFDNRDDKSFQVLINPIITKFYGDTIEDYEGCLSIKDIYGKLPRFSKIRLKALNQQGQNISLRAEGFLARVIQHEVDHTNGILFIDRIKDKPEAFFKLNQEGKLEPKNYEKDIRNNRLLW